MDRQSLSGRAAHHNNITISFSNERCSDDKLENLQGLGTVQQVADKCLHINGKGTGGDTT